MGEKLIRKDKNIKGGSFGTPWGVEEPMIGDLEPLGELPGGLINSMREWLIDYELRHPGANKRRLGLKAE